MSIYSPSPIRKIVTFTYLDERGSHLLRSVSLEGSRKNSLYFLGIDICRILGLHSGALSHAKTGFARVSSNAVGLSTSSGTALPKYLSIRPLVICG